MKRYLPFLIVGLVALLMLGGGALLYRAKRPPTLTIPNGQRASANANNEMMHMRGNPKASVTLDEFGDFECPPCSHLASVIKEVEHDLGDRVRVIFHHFPLEIHAHARAAAHAAEAAGLQGRFWEMHDLLYKEQAGWTKAADVRTMFIGYAGLLGLNMDRFVQDMESEQVKDRVESDAKRGYALGVRNTPTVFINNTELPFASFNPAGIRAAIDHATAKAGR
jgi:protein-disulfide isomerase